MLLQVENLHTDFAPRRAPAVHAVRGVSFSVAKGEMLGIVGESGCGKSVTVMSLVRLIDPPGKITSGKILFDGLDLATLPERAMRQIRGNRIAFIFQDPMTALNPVLTIGTQLIETLRAHVNISGAEASAKAVAWLNRVHIPEPRRRMAQYPHELSGGMRQRVMIAMAFALQPEVLIADEPTTALDVTVQAQILDLMDEMRRESQTSVVLITHDLGIVAERCDRVAVMYAGRIVETASVDTLFREPKHPYTQALLAALPDITRTADEGPLTTLPGQPPRLVEGAIPPGCPFAPRCVYVMDICRNIDPPEIDLHKQSVKCHLYDGTFAAAKNE
jgi:oligopeptide/dipeptide ABC transporter ATP-binding protein